MSIFKKLRKLSAKTSRFLGPLHYAVVSVLEKTGWLHHFFREMSAEDRQCTLSLGMIYKWKRSFQKKPY
jgi:hypothetical protein